MQKHREDLRSWEQCERSSDEVQEHREGLRSWEQCLRGAQQGNRGAG